MQSCLWHTRIHNKTKIKDVLFHSTLEISHLEYIWEKNVLYSFFKSRYTIKEVNLLLAFKIQIIINK